MSTRSVSLRCSVSQSRSGVWWVLVVTQAAAGCSASNDADVNVSVAGGSATPMTSMGPSPSNTSPRNTGGANGAPAPMNVSGDSGSITTPTTVVMNPATNEPCTTSVADFENAEDNASWFLFNDDTPGGTGQLEMTAATSGLAAHVTGAGFVDWGAGLGFAVEPTPCLDWAASTGVRFQVKSSTAFTFGASVRGVLPAAEGGTCVPNAMGEGCYDTHSVALPAAPDWQERTLYWTELVQGGWGTPTPFVAADILQLQFTFLPTQMPFDFAVDDVTLLDTPGGAPPASNPVMPTPDPTTTPDPPAPTQPADSALGQLLTQNAFINMFPDRDPFYTYEGLIEAARRFPGFAGEGSDEVKLREIAAFLGNVAHETGHLVYIHEISPPHAYCDQSGEFAAYPCAPGASYHGRGPIQLSWNYNYGYAGDYLGMDLVSDPNVVSNDPAVAWATALWFWMTSEPEGLTPHQAIVNGAGFGATIRIINGNLECNGANPATVDARVKYFQGYAAILGVSPGENLYC